MVYFKVNRVTISRNMLLINAIYVTKTFQFSFVQLIRIACAG
jgi:hypothetical protein